MSETLQESYKLSDNTIAQIVQLIQLGILTGTDVSDQMRTLRVILGETGTLEPCPSYMEVFNDNMERMQTMAAEAPQELEENE